MIGPFPNVKILMSTCIAKAASAHQFNVLMSSTSKHNMPFLAIAIEINNLINVSQSYSVDLLVLADKKLTPNSTSGRPLLHKNIIFISNE